MTRCLLISKRLRPPLSPGMTVEVLGTVLGTAIQGQIVGMANAPCLPGPGEIVADTSNGSLVDYNVSDHSIYLQHTVNSCLLNHLDCNHLNK